MRAKKINFCKNLLDLLDFSKYISSANLLGLRLMKVKKTIFLILGFISLVTGSIGVVLPLLPTVPFLLLSAWFFANSSEKFHKWLLNHRVFGEYIKNYKYKKGMLLTHKIRTLILLWVGIGFSLYMMRNMPEEKFIWVIIFLLIVLIGVTIHILMLNTVKNDKQKPS